MLDYEIIISCEHAGNELPENYTTLFQPRASLLASHRGWDHGALLVAKNLANLLNAPLFFTTISRLLVDTNRSLGNRNLFSEISRQVSFSEKKQILDHYYLPHRQKILAEINAIIAQGKPVLHLAIHSFTPILAGKKRNADLGLLYDSKRPEERYLCQVWQAKLKNARPDLTTRRNYPYRGQSDGLATYLRKKFPEEQYLGVEVEINQQRLLNPAEPVDFAELLSLTLRETRSPPIPANNDQH